MRWKYLDSDRVFKIKDDDRTIHGIVRDNGMITVNCYARDEMEKLFGFPLQNNVELVVKVVGVRLPPNEWCRVVGK